MIGFVRWEPMALRSMGAKERESYAPSKCHICVQDHFCCSLFECRQLGMCEYRLPSFSLHTFSLDYFQFRSISNLRACSLSADGRDGESIATVITKQTVSILSSRPAENKAFDSLQMMTRTWRLADISPGRRCSTLS